MTKGEFERWLTARWEKRARQDRHMRETLIPIMRRTFRKMILEARKTKTLVVPDPPTTAGRRDQ